MTKNVRFDYFKVNQRYLDEEQNVMVEDLCDLTDVLQETFTIPITERTFPLGQDQARLQHVEEVNNKWQMHFLRIRKDNFPIKTHDNGDFGFFDDLDDAEGFGEEVSALYDPDNCVIMVRRNMHSISPSAISNFITELINQPGLTIIFKPLIHPRAIELLSQDHLLRGAKVSIADVKNSTQNTKRSLGRIIGAAEEIDESVNIDFKISLEQKGSKKYSKIPIYEDVINFAEDPNVKSVEVRKKEDEDSKVEYIDLIKDRLYDYHRFTETDINEESRNIRHGTVINRMQILYRARIEDINNVYE